MPKHSNTRVHWMLECSKCLEWPSALGTQVLEMSSESPTVSQSASASSVRVPKSPSNLRVPWMFSYPLSFFKCTLRDQVSHHMWLEENNTKYKKMCCVNEKREKWWKKFWQTKFWLRIRALLWKAFERGDINLIFVKIQLAFWVDTFVRNFRVALIILT